MFRFAGAIALIRREQGRALEIVPAVEQLADELPAIRAIRAAAAALCVEADARPSPGTLREFSAQTSPTCHATGSFALAMSTAALACAALGDRAAGRRLRDLLVGFADWTVMVGPEMGWAGSISHYLGVLSRTLGEHDDAVTILEHALATHDRMESPTVGRAHERGARLGSSTDDDPDAGGGARAARARSSPPSSAWRVSRSKRRRSFGNERPSRAAAVTDPR